MMAGDWIGVQHATPDKPEIFQVAAILGLDHDAVLGKMIRVWVWADVQTYDGNAGTVTESLIDHIASRPGFAAAMVTVGWLKSDSGKLTFPNFDRHNGATAKQRALTAKRVNRHREGCNAASVTKSLPEKRREREEKPPPPAPSMESPADTTETEWREVEEALIGSKVAAIGKCIEAAQKAGATPGRVLLLIDHHRKLLEQNPSRWKQPAGVLFSRIINDRPAQQIMDAWPDADKGAAIVAANQKQARDRQQQQSRQDAALAVEKRNWARLESRFGVEWDAMTNEARRATAGRLLSQPECLIHSRRIDGHLAREAVFVAAGKAALKSLKDRQAVA